MLGIQPPAHAGAFQPAAQQRQLLIGDGEARAHRGHVEQIENLADAEAAVGQAQQMLQGDDQGLLAAQALVRQGKGNEARIVAGELAEHCADMRGVGVHVRHHDDDVTRAQGRVCAERRQQLVVQHLDLALGAVGDMEAQRVIPGRVDGRPVRAAFFNRAQVEDVVVQLAQQCALVHRAEQVDTLELLAVALRFVVLVEQVDVVTALLAPGSQQRLPMLVQLLDVEQAQLADLPRLAAGLALLPAILVAQQVLVFDDIAPVVLRRVVHVKHHLGEARHGRQGLEHLRRQRGNAEHRDPPRQAPGGRVQLGQPGDEARVHPGTALGQMLLANIGQQRAP
ncbi:hypothetical protein SRABI70_04638 [Pseudomonas sp. Bi70]|nr:hypothetical protein SRABI70_04638 [Pseudomonas sp. Bi70]